MAAEELSPYCVIAMTIRLNEILELEKTFRACNAIPSIPSIFFSKLESPTTMRN